MRAIIAIVIGINLMGVAVSGYVNGWLEGQARVTMMQEHEAKIAAWKRECRGIGGKPMRLEWDHVCVKGEVLNAFNSE